MKSIVINPQNDRLYSDHLAPLASLLNIPYMVSDNDHADYIRRYYPSVQVLISQEHLSSPKDLFHSYDIMIQPLFFQREEFHQMIASVGKPVRSIYCPHGYSDKPPIDTSNAHVDMNLVYGDNMIDLYRHHHMSEYKQHIAFVGNYRSLYYQQHTAFYRDLITQEVSPKFSDDRTTILYAPTWKDNQNSSSFFIACETLIDALSSHYNLIIKLHPSLRRDHIDHVLHIVEKYGNKDGILIIDGYWPAYPILDYTDIYIGDISSVGYDFLTFNRPMFFIDKDNNASSNDRRYAIFSCGTVITPGQLHNILSILTHVLHDDDTCFSVARKQMYHYTFAPITTPEELRHNIFTTVSSHVS